MLPWAMMIPAVFDGAIPKGVETRPAGASPARGFFLMAYHNAHLEERRAVLRNNLVGPARYL
jgi:hypothetical protein